MLAVVQDYAVKFLDVLGRRSMRRACSVMPRSTTSHPLVIYASHESLMLVETECARVCHATGLQLKLEGEMHGYIGRTVWSAPF